MERSLREAEHGECGKVVEFSAMAVLEDIGLV